MAEIEKRNRKFGKSPVEEELAEDRPGEIAIGCERKTGQFRRGTRNSFRLQSNRNPKRPRETKNHAKKKTLNYIERDEVERAEFLKKLEEIPEDKRVYIDESGKNTDLDRTHGYAPRGEKVEGAAHGRKPEKLNIVAAKCGGKVFKELLYNCAMKSWLFEFWFAMLLEMMSPGHWFIMDNATFHRKDVLREMAGAVGCHVLFLPAYSPDFNKIEPEWANLKTFLRNHGRNYASVRLAVYHYFKSS